MTVRLEHANLVVSDLEATLRFLGTAFPDFRVRGSGRAAHGERWVHFGTDHTYLALHEAVAPSPERWKPYSGKPGLNHLGFEVDDVEAVRRRLAEAGYRDSTVPNEHPSRRRVYFANSDGTDWEFVEYRTPDLAQRNDYALPDVV